MSETVAIPVEDWELLQQRMSTIESMLMRLAKEPGRSSYHSAPEIAALFRVGEKTVREDCRTNRLKSRRRETRGGKMANFIRYDDAERLYGVVH